MPVWGAAIALTRWQGSPYASAGPPPQQLDGKPRPRAGPRARRPQPVQGGGWGSQGRPPGGSLAGCAEANVAEEGEPRGQSRSFSGAEG